MLLNTNEYIVVLQDIKGQIRFSQYAAASDVNNRMLSLYWYVGDVINQRSVWGNKFVSNLSRDIKLEFPTITGFSVRNLKYMAKFAATWDKGEIVQRSLHKLPWRHNIVLMEKLKDKAEREWYAKKTIENGWSRDVLVHQIEYDLYHRQVTAKKVSNFKKRLAMPQSELATQTMKDPYIFDFVSVQEGMIERDIEDELVKNVTKLLLELGSGFAFLGHQYHIEVSGKDFYIDLLFYHTVLHC
jgi:predicted nuclease of restriction endonuclease-like (RecB) superfamily